MLMYGSAYPIGKIGTNLIPPLHNKPTPVWEPSNNLSQLVVVPLEETDHKLITYNIQIEPLEGDYYCEKRIQEISKYLKKQNADVICLQEVATPETKRIIEEVCKEKYHIIHSNCLKIENDSKFVSILIHNSFMSSIIW